MAMKLREWSASERKAAQASAKAWQDFFANNGAATAAQQTELEAIGRVVEVRQLHEPQLIALDGVVGVAESYKVKAGKPTRTWAIIVLVEQKRPKSAVGKSDLVPAEIDGVPTDVVEVGKIEALVFNAKTRPVRPASASAITPLPQAPSGASCVAKRRKQRPLGTGGLSYAGPAAVRAKWPVHLSLSITSFGPALPKP